MARMDVRTQKLRHGKPRNDYRATLKEVTQEDMERLLQGVLTTILNDPLGIDACVMIAMSYITKLPPDFPRGAVLKREGFVDYHVYRCKKVLEWLNKHGYTTISTKNIRGHRLRAGKLLYEIEKKLEV